MVGTSKAMTTTQTGTGIRAQIVDTAPSPAADTAIVPARELRKPLRPAQMQAIWTLSGLGKGSGYIGNALSISSQVVRKYLSEGHKHPEAEKALDAWRGNVTRAFGMRLTSKGMRILESITRSDLAAVSPQQRAVVGAIMLDKAKVVGEFGKTFAPPAPPEDGMPTQRDLTGVLASIRERVGRLTVLQVDLSPVKERVDAVLVDQTPSP